MAYSRKNFIAKACLTGACFCGFTSLVQAGSSVVKSTNDEHEDLGIKLMQDWISTLLQSIDQAEDATVCRKIMKSCARSHFEHLQMNDMLKPYEGDMEKFISFIEQKWGWKIQYQKEEGLLIADENKNYCVCPMVNAKDGLLSTILCYCSEGFAELMFSKVVGHPVEAIVEASVLRGDSSCRYWVRFN